MKEVLSNILNAFVWALIFVLLFLVGSGIYQHTFKKGQDTGFFGIGYAVVVSGSMEPNIRINDMILYQEQDASKYAVGQVIVYRRTEANGDEILITHRIQQISGDTLITKGDANATEDVPVSMSQVVGHVVWIIPFLGFFVNFVRNPWGMAIVIAVLVIIVIASLIIGRMKKKKENDFEDDFDDISEDSEEM